MRELMRPISRISNSREFWTGWAIAGLLLLLALLVCVLAGQAFAQTGVTDARTCVATSAAPTYAEGTRNPLSCDLSGTLRSTAGSGGGGDGAILDGVTSSIKATVFDFTNSNPVGVTLRDTNGDAVSVGGGTQYNQGTVTTDTDSLTMAGCVRADTAAVATGVVDGDRARCIVDATGRMWVHVGTIDGGTITSITNPVAVTGTFFQATQPISAVALPLPTGASTLAEQQTQTTALQLIDNLPLAQGAATAGQSGVLAQGAVTTGAPTYTTGNTNPLSLNTAGGLRVDGSAVTQPISGTVAATQSGIWTVQPGNTPNTAPWLTESIKVASANNTGSCPSGAANTTALASNASRRAAYLAASSANTDDVFLKLGATATSSNFRLAPGQAFNLLGNSIYTGIIDFLPASGTQAVCVAEVN